MNNRLIKSNDAGGGGACTNTVDLYNPFPDGGGVALYQLNGDATDVSGNYNGTPSGTIPYTTGVFGQAADFSSTTNVIQTDIPFTIVDSFSFWAYTNADTRDGYVIGAPNTTSKTAALINTTQVEIWIKTYYASYDWNESGWHHFCGVLDGTTVRIYIDGQDVNATQGGNIGTTDENLRIGSLRVSYCTTQVDQVRIFNTALTPLEVEALYTEELCICDGTVDTLDILGDGSCIATYQLDGNANDLSGNYSGTPTDVSYGVGEFDLAGVFNGSSSKVVLGSLSQFSSNTVSFSLWFNSTSVSTTAILIGSNQNAIFAGELDLYTYNSGFLLTVATASNVYRQWTTPANLSNNTWHNVVVTLDSGTSEVAKIYLDGNEQTKSIIGQSGTISGVLLNSASNLNLGVDNVPSSYFNGSIDQVRIFNKALSSGEVTTLYNETACTKAACTGTTNTLDILGDSSCIATYPLDGSPADLSGNYNGVQTNVTYPQGYFDLAGSFNGSTSRIDMTPAVQQQALSVSTWVKYTSTDPYKNIWRFEVLPLDPPVGTALFLLTHPSGLIGVAMATSQTFRFNYIHPTTNLNDGQWHHIVFSWDGTTNANAVKLYIDEVVATSTSTIAASSMAVYDTFNLARDWNGNLDQVRIFNKALSAGEVTTLYNETPCN